jgi:hypothetical protein
MDAISAPTTETSPASGRPREIAQRAVRVRTVVASRVSRSGGDGLLRSVRPHISAPTAEASPASLAIARWRRGCDAHPCRRLGGLPIERRCKISFSYRRKNLQRGHYGPAADCRPRPGQMGAPHGVRLAVRSLHWLFRDHTVRLLCLAPAVGGRRSSRGRRGTFGRSASFYTRSDS